MNLAAGVLMFREGLEAALVVAIMLGYLRKVGRNEHQMAVWGGALLAGALALGFTLVLQLVGAQFDYPAKGIYEGVTSLLAVVMLTYMSFWMARHARYIKGSLEQSMKASFLTGASWGLFGVAFLTVAREGVETALFLSASAFQSTGMATLLGGLAGLTLAILVACGVYVAGLRLNLRTFFRVTSLLLVIFGAAILRYAVHEFEEVGWLPILVDPIWNTAAVLPESSVPGQILQALVGYVSKPTLLQAIAYFGYIIVVGILLLRPVKKTSQVAPASSAAAPSAELSASSQDKHATAEKVTV
jgi:high-affinity iron transporter